MLLRQSTLPICAAGCIFPENTFRPCSCIARGPHDPWHRAVNGNASACSAGSRPGIRGRTAIACAAAERDQLQSIAAEFSNAPLRSDTISNAQADASDQHGGGGSSGQWAASGGGCWLVGAGPGALEHLTLGAAALIRQADVIVYDDLGTQAAMEAFAPESAERIYVGKRGLQKSFKQSQIDALLVERCLQGNKVVRLKGGCPSTFSRVSGEMAALAAANVPFSLVPGISSALAAPLLAGFPLTEKLMSGAFTVVSGHDPDKLDWGALEGFQTLVILMGGHSLPGLVAKLQSITEGDPPLALIRDASSLQQRVWTATVGTVVEATKGEVLSPSIIVVGEVVSLMQLSHPTAGSGGKGHTSSSEATL